MASTPGEAPKRRASRKASRDALAAIHPLVCVSWVATMMLVARWSVLFNLPPPLPLDADPALFSEARALVHARALADDIGVRVVGTPGVELAETYVSEACGEIVELARSTRDDLRVDLSVHRPTGSFRLNFLNNDIANAYTNLTNVVIRVAAAVPSSPSPPAVLLNAHFDTTLGSPGAADCAECVGILLEILRLHVAALPPPEAPLVFLFNGGEETFMQAAHGFVAHHPWSRDAGAVINVEATGSGGPDVLFREAGGWPAATYARAVPHPVTTATIRDLVRFANLPVDTDFSVFADPAERDGNLPGVDLASMLDGYSYHTDADVADRIRRGSVQAYGENVLAASSAFAAELARRAAAGHARPDAPTRPGEGGAFFDVFGVVGVAAPGPVVSAAAHIAPLAWCVVDAAKNGRARRASYLAGVKTAVASAAYAMLAPAALGASRAATTGKPLAWFGDAGLAFALYVPVAVIATYLPYVRARHAGKNPADGARGLALVASASAAVAGVAGAATGYLHAAVAVGVSAAAATPPRVSERVPFAALALVAPAVALAAPTAYVTFVLISEKVGIAGSEPWPFGLIVGDATMGLAAGAATALVSAATAPFAACSRRFARRFIFFVAVTWTVAAAFASLAVASPYSARAPKRLAVLHQHDAGATGDDAARFFVGAFDSVPAAAALAPSHRAAAIRPTTREDFASMHPVTQLLGEGIVLRARDADRPPWGAEAPELTVELAQPASEPESEDDDDDFADASATSRLEVTFRSRAPAWSCARVRGRVTAWSLSGTLPRTDPLWARHAGNGDASETWTFWVETRRGDEDTVEVDAWALYPGETKETREVTEGKGEGVSVIAATTYRVETARVQM